MTSSDLRFEAEPSAGIKAQAVSGMLWMGGARFATQVLDQIFTIVMVRLLAPGDFGLMAMAGVFTSLLNIVSDMGIARAVVQRADIDDEYLSTAFWGNMLSGAVLCIVAIAASVPITRLYGQPLVQPVLAALSLRFILAGVGATQIAILTREMKFASFTIRNVTSTIAGGIVGVALAFKGLGVWSLVAQALTIYVSKCVLLWVATSWRPRRIFNWAKFVDLWYFGSRVLGSRIFGYVVKQCDNFLIGRALGATMLGYYAFAYGFFLSPLIDISFIVGRVTFSAFSRLQDDLQRLRLAFMLTTRYISFFAFPVLFGFFLVTPDLVAVVFGQKWMPSVPVLRILLIAGILSSHHNIWASIFQARGKPDWLLKWSAVSAFLYVPAFIVGLRWGIVGVAAGYLVSTLVLVPVQLMLVQRLLHFRMREYLATFQPILIASGAMGVCVVLMQGWLAAQDVPVAGRFAGAVLIGALSYSIVVVLIQRELVMELVRVLRGLRRPRRGRHRLAEEAV